MSDAQAIMLTIVLAPMALVAIIGMFKGYHILIHIYKGDKHSKRTDEES